MKVNGTNFQARSLKAAQSVFQNHYSGAEWGSPRRALVPAFYRDARFDANQFTRYEMARKIRDFERNVWIIGTLKATYSRYSVGPNGLKVVPASSDEAWNKRAEYHYERYCEAPSRDSALPMGEQHQLIADTTHIDGGLFVNFTSRKPGKGQSVPAIQLIEGHRCATPGAAWSDSIGAVGARADVVDGVNIDSAGRPDGYWIREGINDDEYVFRPLYDPARPWAGGVMHVYDPDRIGQYRELTPYHAVINQIQDLDILRLLEMDRAKANGEIALHLETVDGELPDAAALLRQGYNKSTATGAASSPDEDLQKRIQQYRTVYGARWFATKVGEKVNQLGAESPSAATQWYWLQLYEEICASVSIPLLMVLPRSIQGTVARGILDDANIWFTDRFHTFCRPVKAAYLHFISWARFNIPELADPPADWMRCHITPPRACNVDVGYNAAAELAAYEAGFTNLDDIAGKNGKTARELIEKKARNIGLIKQIAKAVSKDMGEEVTPEEISQSIADALEKNARANQANANAERVEEPANA